MTAPFRDPRPSESKLKIWPPEERSLEQIASYAAEGRRLRNEAVWDAAQRAVGILRRWTLGR